MIPDGKKLDAESRRVTFVDYNKTEKNFSVFDREKLLQCEGISRRESEMRKKLYDYGESAQ